MTVDLAREFRAKGAALARAKTDGFQGVYFGLCTTLATRIRSEVSINVKVLSKKKKVKDL
jgi:hypothetical protein